MRNDIAKMWIQLGIMTGKNLNKEMIDMMLSAVSDLPQNRVFEELKNWAMNETTFPMPAHIRAKVLPQLDDRDHAIDAVNRIIESVSRFGWSNAQAAEKFMGQLAWETVQRFGGWKTLCESLSSENEGIFRAQLRELALVVSKKSKRGELDYVPALPQSAEVKKLIADFTSQK